MMRNCSAIKIVSAIVICCIFLCSSIVTLAQQQSKDLSNLPWKIWLDEKAEWINDSLFLSTAELKDIPVHPPSCGWSKLYDGRGKTVVLPANVEEHFWGYNGNTFGIASNYKGVSWFFTNLFIPLTMKGNRIVLNFESTRLRAEIYLNEELVGYDLMNGTSYDVDITKEAKPGAVNKLAIRITDPDGNFEWMDLAPHTWGNYKIPPSHGFGGITGKVYLSSTPSVFISDLFIKNKPTVNSVDAEVELNEASSGNMQLQLIDVKKPTVVLQTKNIAVSGQSRLFASFTLDNAKLWSVETPNLYIVKAIFKNKNGSVHQLEKHFGFRWFEVKDMDGDKQFFLNGKRIVIRTSISWGYWPVNGITPTYELAKKQVALAKELGLNCLNFHRHMGQELLLDLADEMGLLYYAEPGGYKTGIAGKFTADWNRERMMRMIKQFRSHPSLVIFNMINESTRDPLEHEYDDIRLFHQLDETRCITFTSTNFTPKYYNGKLPEAVEMPVKMHMLPYDTTVYFKGWWDEHYADGPGVYKDDFYKNPESFLRNSTNKSEIVFWGEDGAIGTPERIQLASAKLINKNKGWDGEGYIKQFNAWKIFLKEKGFDKAFPSVDSLCVSFGNNALYYQGRIIENIRINNTTDGYVVNGWEGTKIENHSGVVDVWRNAKGNPAIMAHYNQPLYVAVKARSKVLTVGETSMVDFFIVNEKNLKGNYQLVITAKDEKGEIFSAQFNVKISGGNQYGELLQKAVEIKTANEGYTFITAQLKQNGTVFATGKEELYAVSFPVSMFTQKVFVNDTGSSIQKTFTEAGIAFENVKGQFSPVDGILVLNGNNMNYVRDNWRVNNDFIEWVSNGNTVICLENCDLFAEFLERKEVLDYYGKQEIGKVWYGGNYFNRAHPIFNGLPQNTAFNWEWQSLAVYELKRYGLRLKGEQTIAGVYADHRQEMYSALAIVPVGRGQILLSTFDFAKAINAKSKASVIAKRLLLNYLFFSKQVMK